MSGPTMLHLAAQPQALDQRPVSIRLRSPHELEEPSAPAHQFQQTPARMVILAVLLEMLGKTVDALREERDLYVRRTRVRTVNPEGLHGLFLERAGNQLRPRRQLTPVTPSIPFTPYTPDVSRRVAPPDLVSNRFHGIHRNTGKTASPPGQEFRRAHGPPQIGQPWRVFATVALKGFSAGCEAA